MHRLHFHVDATYMHIYISIYITILQKEWIEWIYPNYFRVQSMAYRLVQLLFKNPFEKSIRIVVYVSALKGKTNGQLKAKSLSVLSIHTEMTQFVPNEREKRMAEWPLAPIIGTSLYQNQKQLQKESEQTHTPACSIHILGNKLKCDDFGVDLISCFRVQWCSFRRILFSAFIYALMLHPSSIVVHRCMQQGSPRMYEIYAFRWKINIFNINFNPPEW